MTAVRIDRCCPRGRRTYERGLWSWMIDASSAAEEPQSTERVLGGSRGIQMRCRLRKLGSPNARFRRKSPYSVDVGNGTPLAGPPLMRVSRCLSWLAVLSLSSLLACSGD